MKIRSFLYEKIGIILLNSFALLFLSLFLKLLAVIDSALFLIVTCWILILFAVFLQEYTKRKRKYQKIENQMEQLKKKYLICEILDKPENQMEKVYYTMVKTACKAMTDEIGEWKEKQLSYKEYIEEWIHEIKTPITAIDLICKNHESNNMRRILKELSEVNYLVEQALYYARSEMVEQDYFIKEFCLFDGIRSAILFNRTALLEKKIALRIDETEEIVCTDEKWLGYIVNQIFSNSIKYAKEKSAQIHIYSEKLNQGISLIIEDNGVGITEEDLPRVFQKGFTGENRKNKKATGLGLYLCKKLCDKLGLEIRIESEKEKYTRVILSFPVGKMHQIRE